MVRKGCKSMELSDIMIRKLTAGLYSSFRDYLTEKTEQDNQQGDKTNAEVIQEH